MATEPLDDPDVAGLRGVPIASEVHAGVRYHLERVLGRGGHAVACLARRTGRGGTAPVVLKVTRPRMVAESGDVATRVVRKEAVALGRLNERVPPSPFVVRLLDTGTVRISTSDGPLDTPWIALEYVHGGLEGTTLRERVESTVKTTGFGFDAVRAARAIDQLASGLTEVHQVSVVHRDVTPGNVLCCGAGDTETFKLSDFGIARPSGMASTFGDMTLGTLGYVAPEQIHRRDDIGPWTDVFAFAGIIYFLLTGERYFRPSSGVQAVMLATSESRPRLADAERAAPSVVARPDAAQAIDGALARATAPSPGGRFQTPRDLATAVLAWLDGFGPRAQVTEAITTRVETAGWEWTMRSPPQPDAVVARVAWEPDGHCLALTTAGLRYFDGTAWAPVSALPPSSTRSIHVSGPGRFVLAGEDGSLAELTAGVTRRHDRGSALSAGFELVDGNLDDLAVAVVRRPGAGLGLAALCGGRWLKPLPIDAASVLGLARASDETWLLVGRTTERAYAALYSPLAFDIAPLEVPAARALLSCAGDPRHRVAMGVGAAGAVVGWVDGRSSQRVLPDAPDLSACAVDESGAVWAAGTGRLWAGRSPGELELAWQDSSWSAPFVSLHADVGRVVAVTAEGALLEGRAPAPG